MSLNNPPVELRKYRLVNLITLGLLFASSVVMAASPKTAPDDTWINVSGTVTEVKPGSFVFDYGDFLEGREFVAESIATLSD